MPKNDIFFDSRALIVVIVSAQGAARALLLLVEDEKILISVSGQVIVEVEGTSPAKAPKALPFARGLILCANIRILHDPQISGILEHQDRISYPADVPILVVAARPG
jgi:predicted nucleic acid-binding protein